MPKLPDLEGLAIFAKVAECRSFAEAASELRLSKATVSKAIGRIESRLGARLIIRTARRFALTDAGRQLVGRAAHILAAGEAAEDITQAQVKRQKGWSVWRPPFPSVFCTLPHCFRRFLPPTRIYQSIYI
jgi:DNA-binding transcriptional LysR family regulator